MSASYPKLLHRETLVNGPAGMALNERTAPVSVVVPCFRCAATIDAAVDSIAAQTLRPAEVVLVDDCSGDGTLHHLQRLADTYPAGWIRVLQTERNGGPSCARNRGWHYATQEYIAFLDADDSWHPRKIELQLEVVRADPAIALVGHPMDVRPADAPPRMVRLPVCTYRVRPVTMLLTNALPTASVLLKRDLPFRFDERFRRAEDYHLWAQIVFTGHRCAKLNEVLASWHKPPFGAGGLSGDIEAMHRAGIEARNALYAQGYISKLALYLAHSVAVLRHARRRLLTCWNRWLRVTRANGRAQS